MSIEDLIHSRFRAVATVVLVWAVVYLPALGSIAIKGEEGRRILPAVQMLETGNYIVPQVGGNTYYRKPPLVNWLVAASFKFCGVRNEWTARLPSALSVLAVAVAFVTVACASLGSRGSIIAAMIWLTNIGIIEKGRLIEIEALYVSLCGLAIIFWLSFFLEKKSPWLMWLPASVFLGLGLLAKGPTHLLFFYGIVIAVLACFKDWRVLFHPAHFVGLVVMVGIAAAWAIPFVYSTTSQVAMDKWSGQYTGRLKSSDFKFSDWIQNAPRGLIYFLPWLLLFPFTQFSKLQEKSDQRLARGLSWGIAVPFLAVNLVPGGLPRYSMPAIVPASWLLGMICAGNALQFPRLWMRDARILSKIIAAFVGLGLLIGAIGYPVTAIVLKNRQQVKKAAAEINALVPANETLYAVNPDYQPVFFYVKSPVQYVSHVKNLPSNVRYFLVRNKNEEEALAARDWAPLRARPIARVRDYSKRELVLFEVAPANKD
ncbi:MAG TPA: glycosyltransferase family 39 protein [Candidatus Tectomicrobia bacterium]|nr:glycosyltransferase family 39 protein [Candidatus Tectomicrobia bacterium]